MVISPREARAKNFTLTFQLSGWALVAPLCFALQVQYVRGSMLQRDVLSGEGGPEPEHLLSQYQLVDRWAGRVAPMSLYN